jgi:hypothetical protein
MPASELRRFVAAFLVGLGAFVATFAAGCTHREPPAPEGSPSVSGPELAVPSVPSVPSGPGAIARLSSAAAVASAPGSSASAGSTPAPTASVDPASLPQTHDRPAASGQAFDARVAALWSAIVADDPQQGAPFFFPVAAYQQVKDIPDPASDWKHRLFAAYARDIHALHARLGSDATRATFDGIDVPEARGRWVDPGEEYNKIGYYRVFGSRLRYNIDGAPHTFDVKSLISWRGEWFVVHLSAIQ